jgi:hypothetical protein
VASLVNKRSEHRYNVLEEQVWQTQIVNGKRYNTHSVLPHSLANGWLKSIEDPIVDELDARLGVMEDQIEDYERSIVELGFMEF